MIFILKVLLEIWAASLAFIGACIVCYHFYDAQRGSYEQRYLQRLFHNCWNGEEADRADGWFRVSQHLRHTKAAKSLIMMADYRYRKAMQITSKAVSVDLRGKIIDQAEPGDGQAVV